MSENIFETTSSLQVSFERLKQNLVKRGQSRLLSQFWKSSLLIALLDSISQECQELYDAEIGIQEGRILENAKGVNLDVLGDIVGADKILYNYSLLPWFASDVPGRELDSADVWVTNAPTSSNVVADDNIWKRIILAKIFKNHMIGASPPEIRFFVKMLFNLKITLIPEEVCRVSLGVSSTTPKSVVRFLVSLIKNTSIDFSYLLPVPPECELNTDIYLILLQNEDGVFRSFAPDQEQGKSDYGMATLKIGIGE